MNKWNKLSCDIQGHYIYIVSFGNYYYIGETGGHPVIRWGQHLSNKSGSLMKNLKSNYDEELSLNNKVDCFSYYCDCVFEEDTNKQRLARRAIEAELHYQFCSKGSVHLDEFCIVSTPPTFPIRHKFQLDAEKIAIDILNEYFLSMAR